MLRFASSLTALAVLALGVIALLPREWHAAPISTEPRSMMASGFVNDHIDVGPWTWWWSDHIDMRVDHPAETNIVIWNHHTEAMGTAPSCHGSLYFPPPSIMALEEIGRTRVYYLCTKTAQHPDKPHFALQRRDEILTLVRRFRALGVPAERIFLSGQSGGSCASLFALGAAPAEMNAGILFAPACIGTGEGFRRSAGLAGPVAQEIAAEMLSADTVTAMLVAFEADSWNKPGDLSYLADRWPGSTEIFSPECGANHSGAFHGCGLDAVATEVRDYFRRRLKASGVFVPGTQAPDL